MTGKVNGKLPLCKCGCGGRVTKPKNRYIIGHTGGRIKRDPPKPKFCKCGCGKYAKSGNDYIHGHQCRGVKNTPVHNLAISKAKTGVPLSPEHIAASTKGLIQHYIEHPEDRKKQGEIKKQYIIDHPEELIAMSERTTLQFDNHDSRDEMSEILRNSKAAILAAEVQRGGTDLVWHHIAYDFGRPDSLKVRIKRKFHGAIHHPKGIQFSVHGYSLID